jgi:hypothetical protein
MTLRGQIMNYKEYCAYALLKRFQPLREEAFKAMKAAGFFS